MTSRDDRLVQAIRNGTVPETLAALAASGDDVAREQRAMTALRIANGEERDHLLAVLRAVGVDATSPEATGARRTLRLVELAVRDRGQAAVAVDALEDAGYRRWAPSAAGPWRSYLATESGVSLTRLDDHPTRVELRWTGAGEPTGLTRFARPTSADRSFVTLPAPLWWAYPAVRPVRVAASRLGRATTRDLGPYLATPPAIVRAVIDMAAPTQGDLVVDIGCGDGRLLVDAALRHGGRGLGVERDAELAALARRHVAEAGLTDRVRIEHGDALTTDLSAATIVLLFLPAHVVGELLPGLLRRLRPGTAVLAHEQEWIDAHVAPASTVPVITEDGVSVVSRWYA